VAVGEHLGATAACIDDARSNPPPPNLHATRKIQRLGGPSTESDARALANRSEGFETRARWRRTTSKRTPKALAELDSDGLMKLLFPQGQRRSARCPTSNGLHAADLIQEIRQRRGPAARGWRELPPAEVHTHPTLSELVEVAYTAGRRPALRTRAPIDSYDHTLPPAFGDSPPSPQSNQVKAGRHHQ